MSLFFIPGLWPLAEIANSGDALDVRTVLLVVALAGLAYVARQLSVLRAEIETLRRPAEPAKSSAGSAPVAPVRSVAPSSAPVGGPPSSGEMVAIVAAIHAVLGRNARLVAVAPVPSSHIVWSLEGRREVFRSHQVR